MSLLRASAHGLRPCAICQSLSIYTASLSTSARALSSSSASAASSQPAPAPSTSTSTGSAFAVLNESSQNAIPAKDKSESYLARKTKAYRAHEKSKRKAQHEYNVALRQAKEKKRQEILAAKSPPPAAQDDQAKEPSLVEPVREAIEQAHAEKRQRAHSAEMAALRGVERNTQGISQERTQNAQATASKASHAPDAEDAKTSRRQRRLQARKAKEFKKAFLKQIKQAEPRLKKAQTEARVVSPDLGEQAGKNSDEDTTASAENRYRMQPEWTVESHPALQSSSQETDPTGRPSTLPADAITLDAAEVSFAPAEPIQEQPPIATLSHGLERVLFSPGPHFLRDPRTGVYNFSPSLEKVPATTEFEFDKLPQYITASKDADLVQIAERENSKFVSSTSSCVGMLCQIYFWLSKGRQVNLSMLSDFFNDQPRDFSAGQQLPCSVILHPNGNLYAVDADKSVDPGSNTNILADYGHMMEKLLTCPPEEFERFLKDAKDPAKSEASSRQAYHYMKFDKMLLRSQLDAAHDLLPNKSFDLKTRGSHAVRQDRLNYEEAAGYQIDRLRGQYMSFEREYYDLIRSAFLKYQFQARIGNMDGILVAHHSTTRFFGFHYIPISEMDEALFGSPEAGDRVFRLATGILQPILDRLTTMFDGAVSGTFAADPTTDRLLVFARPYDTQNPSDDSGRIKLLEVSMLHRATDGVEPNELPTSVTYTMRESDTEDDQSPVAPQRIRKMLAKVRRVQNMFRNLVLPTGVNVADVRAAAERAKNVDPSVLDPSDLSLRFPLDIGLTYRNAPSKNVRHLRQIAREGTAELKKREELEQQDSTSKKVYRLRTTLVEEDVD